MDKDIFDYVNLLAKYGYMYENHTDPKWYYITQVLIWRTVSPSSSFYFTNDYNGEINESLFLDEINEIESLVSKHYELPKIDITKIYDGNEEKYYIGDNYEVTGDVLYDSGYIIIIGKGREINFKISKKKDMNYARIYVSNNSQNILKYFSEPDVEQKYNINVLPKGSITLKKFGEEVFYDNNEITYKEIILSDVSFGLFDEAGNLLKTLKTNERGQVSFDNLEYGKYMIKELKTLDGYIKSDEERWYVVSENDEELNINDVFKNYLEKGILKIVKVDSATFEGISDTLISIKTSDGNLVYRGLTDSNGEIKLENILVGKYNVTEDMASSGYLNVNSIYEVDIDADAITTVVIENERVTIDIPDTNIEFFYCLVYKKEKLIGKF